MLWMSTELTVEVVYAITATMPTQVSLRNSPQLCEGPDALSPKGMGELVRFGQTLTSKESTWAEGISSESKGS